jgi:hypothetical protein
MCIFLFGFHAKQDSTNRTNADSPSSYKYGSAVRNAFDKFSYTPTRGGRTVCSADVGVHVPPIIAHPLHLPPQPHAMRKWNAMCACTWSFLCTERAKLTEALRLLRPNTNTETASPVDSCQLTLHGGSAVCLRRKIGHLSRGFPVPSIIEHRN